MTTAGPEIGVVSKTIVVLDACVLYPPSLRDLLMRVAVAGSFEPRWTEEIHTEWIRNVLAELHSDIESERLAGHFLARRRAFRLALMPTFPDREKFLFFSLSNSGVSE